MHQNSTAAELLQLLAPTVSVQPNQIALFMRVGNNGMNIQHLL